MEPHGQSAWYLHEILSYNKASEGHPPVAKSAEALILRRMNDPSKAYTFIHWAEPVPARRSAIFGFLSP